MKHYYTDPLAAAWMAKKFGMKIEVSHENWLNGKFIERTSSATSDFPGNGDYGDWFRCDKFYIHPDSLALLEPQEKDAVTLIDAHTIIDFKNLDYFKWVFSEREKPSNELIKQIKILQRNGIPFMWPESEE